MKENGLDTRNGSSLDHCFPSNLYPCKKMENHMQPYEMNNDQRRIYIDAVQLHEAYMDAFTKSCAHRGGMH